MRPELPPSRYEKPSPYPEPYLEYGEDTFYGEDTARPHLGWLLLLPILLVMALVAFCLVVPDKWLAVEHMDQAATVMPFDPPRIETQAALMGVSLPPASVQQRLQQRRAFFSGDFEYLDQSLSAQRQQALLNPQQTIGYHPFIEGLEDTALAGLDACQRWLQAMPDSYVAHWVCAEVWNDGAWEARSEKRRSDINIAQTVLMEERLHQSNHLLERALTLDEQPVEALSLLAQNHFLLGTRVDDGFEWAQLLNVFDGKDAELSEPWPHSRTTGLASSYIERALAVYPRYLPAHRTWANFLQPRWGGTQALVLSAIDQAQRAGIEESDLLDMRDDFVVYPATFSTPGATQAYWEKAIAQQPTRKRLEGLLHDQVGRQNWKAIVPAAAALIVRYPDDGDAYYWLAEARKMMGQTDEARAAYLYAAALGNDAAAQELIMAFIRGGLGIDESYAGPSLPQLCHYSAALGSPIGANCLGAGYFEGGQPGVPFARDPGQGYAWHLLASRAGHYNSQFDLGWMLYSGRVPGVDSEQAQALGIFWLRRAEEKGHTFAARRLDELGVDRSTSLISRDNLFAVTNSLKTGLLWVRQQLQSLWA
ncbi:DUF4034 domain-containing protein [Halopseudomonas sabulinigri]|uniref:DUF4034 domain-containing protein n=1 Tax=Halopseudomonas sabulinigri TaxID=472181 RepID=A0ABP9ZJJ2_9GAMM